MRLLVQRSATPETNKPRLMNGLDVAGSLVSAKNPRVTRNATCREVDGVENRSWSLVNDIETAYTNV